MTVSFKNEIVAQPKYMQVAESIKKHILKGRIKTGAQIPNEFVLSEQFSVSRNTVRDAIAMLINENLLERQRGLGTFVKEFRAAKKKTLIQFLLYKVGNPFANAFSNDVYKGVREKIKEYPEYSLEIKEFENGISDMGTHIEELKSSNTKGIILLGKFNRDFIEKCGNEIPLVMTGKVLEGYEGFAVTPDNTEVMKTALEHLIKNGHEKIAYLPSHMHHAGYKEKLEAYKLLYSEYCRKNKLPYEPIFMVGEYEGATEYALKQKPSAIITCSDTGAIACLNTLRGKGFRVPEDISIIALDDVQANLTNPAISVVDIDNESIGKKAMELLIDIIDGKIKKVKRLFAPYKLIERNSVRNIRNKTKK